MLKKPRIRWDLPDAKARTYEVGYGKPPKTSRFKAGQSGNPRGRPKGARNKIPVPGEERLKAIVMEEAYRLIKVNEGERRITLSMARAVVRSIAVNAAKGQARAQQLFTTLVSETERANRALHDAYLDAAIRYKTKWEVELRHRKRLGIKGIEPLPHPDDVVVDVRRGEVTIKGPITPEEKVEWDRLLKGLKDTERELEALHAMFSEAKFRKERERIQKKIAMEVRIREFIILFLGDWRGHDS